MRLNVAFKVDAGKLTDRDRTVNWVIGNWLKASEIVSILTEERYRVRPVLGSMTNPPDENRAREAVRA